MNLNSKNKANKVATTFFTCYMGNEKYQELSISEKLQNLSEKVVILKKKYNHKLHSRLVAKHLLWLIEEYATEHNLCPDCFIETTYQTTRRETYFEQEEGKLCCNDCGWSEAV